MGFIDSYKRLEKLCGEILNDDRKVSAYIDEMINTPGGRFVMGWDEDLKMLKHYRWVRNQIAHEPGCTEENMCERGDVAWLDNFHARIMNRTDPLALYVRATRPQPPQRPKQTYAPQPVRRTPQPTERMPQSARYTYHGQTVGPKKKGKPAGCLTFLFVILLLSATAILILQILQIDFGMVLKYLNLM